tara:strand:+ start:166 stop:300 length:135 start_codon:yes stop_codon:yes gene_type:complete
MSSDENKKKNSMSEQEILEWEAWSKDWIADLQEQDRKREEVEKE